MGYFSPRDHNEHTLYDRDIVDPFQDEADDSGQCASCGDDLDCPEVELHCEACLDSAQFPEWDPREDL